MKLNTFLTKVDCTLLEVDATRKDLRDMTRDACEFGCRAVCVFGKAHETCRLEIAEWSKYDAMRPHMVKLCAVADFPDGSLTTRLRNLRVDRLVTLGFHEVDIVMPISPFMEGNYDLVKRDFSSVVSSHPSIKVKIIAETGNLTDEQILQSAEFVWEAGAFCWKTSTGQEPKVEIPEKARHVRMVREAFPDLTIKAAGGIRTQEDVMMLHEAGADIFGISWKALREIVDEWK